MTFVLRLLRDRKGAALAEYGLLLAGITMVSLVAVSVLGTKVGGLVASVATILPGAFLEQNAPVTVGKLVETRTHDDDGDQVAQIGLDHNRIVHDQTGTPRLGDALGLQQDGGHASSHLYQLGSDPNPFHGGGN